MSKRSGKIKKLLSLLLAFILLFGTGSMNAAAQTAGNVQETEEFSVTVSLEGLTLGQGMYVEPVTYTLSEINALLATKGYGPYDETNLTAAMATVAMFIDKGLDYGNPDPGSAFYLAQVKDIDKKTVNIPSVITENGGPGNDSHEGNTDEWLGQMDYSPMSGWMITVNHNMISEGAGTYEVSDKSVIRWHFSLYGFGADLGIDSGFGAGAYYTAANKDALYRKYAELSANGFFGQNPDARTEALAVMEKLTATQEEADKALAALDKASKPGETPQPDGGDSGNGGGISGETNPGGTDTEALNQRVEEILNATLKQLVITVPEPNFNTVAGDWTVFALARGEYYGIDNKYFTDYYARIVETVNRMADENHKLDQNKSSENSRLILALSSIGKGAESVGEHNLIAPFDDFDWIKYQGINGPAYALLALDSNDYQTKDPSIRRQCIDYILEEQIEGGGWALFGKTADPDMTAMVLQALAPYTKEAVVAEAVEKAFAALSVIQQENGGFGSWGSVNSESIAQVITACTVHGINPAADPRFVKSGGSAVEALLAFYNEDKQNFSHVVGDGGHGIATDQAAYALVSYQRLLEGKASLYDTGDVFLEAAKNQAKEALKQYYGQFEQKLSAYRPAQQEELAAIYTQGRAAIDEAANKDSVTKAVEETKAKLAAVKTKEELNAEEAGNALALAKANAKKEMDIYKNKDDYRPAQQEELKKAIETGRAAIDAAADESGVRAALENAKKAMDAIKTDAQLTEEENADKPQPEKEQITLQDENKTGITISGEKGILTDDGNMMLEATPYTFGEKFELAKKALKEAGNKFRLFDIYLLKNNLEIQPGAPVTLSIPVPEGWDGAKCRVYYISDDGSVVTDMKAVYKDGCMVFETTHFSFYALSEVNAGAENTGNNGSNDKAPTSPQTGDYSPMALWLLAALTSLTVLAVLVRRSRTRI